MRVTEVPLAASSLNDGDVFVADLGARLFVWSGAAANPDEKVKALEVVEARRAARGYQAEARPVRPRTCLLCAFMCDYVLTLEVVEARRAARGYQAEARPACPPRTACCVHLCVITF